MRKRNCRGSTISRSSLATKRRHGKKAGYEFPTRRRMAELARITRFGFRDSGQEPLPVQPPRNLNLHTRHNVFTLLRMTAFLLVRPTTKVTKGKAAIAILVGRFYHPSAVSHRRPRNSPRLLHHVDERMFTWPGGDVHAQKFLRNHILGRNPSRESSRPSAVRWPLDDAVP